MAALQAEFAAQTKLLLSLRVERVRRNKNLERFLRNMADIGREARYILDNLYAGSKLVDEHCTVEASRQFNIFVTTRME